MRFVYLLSFLLLSLASGCQDDNDATPKSTVFGVDWYRASTQPDESGYNTYKPKGTFTYSLRARDGFRFERDGTFVQYTFGPADEGLDITGTWTSEDNKTFHVKPNDTRFQEFVLAIKPIQDDIVQARFIYYLF